MELDELTYKINGLAMKIHNTLDNGFQEVIYQRCLKFEFEFMLCIMTILY